jgi:2-dehydropantoate 2-reductase
MLRVNICGTGAMACLFGARLARVASVTLIGTWVEAIEAIRSRGIQVDEAGWMPARVQGVLRGTPVEPAELVLVLVKTWQNESIAGWLPGLISPGGVALTLQNGLGNRDALGPFVRVGTTTEGAVLVGPGRVRPGGGGPTHAAAPEWVSGLFRQAGFDAHSSEGEDVEALMWGKLVANCGINALTALLRIQNGELLARPDANTLMCRAAAECAAVAHARGIVLPFADPVRHTRDVASRTAQNCSSMLQDLLRGAPTECDAINGAVVREGRRLGVPTPVNERLWQRVRSAVANPGEQWLP